MYEEPDRTVVSEESAAGPPAPPVLVVSLSVENYVIGLPAQDIEKITPMVFVSPIPRAPEAVRGTINYRGSLTPVLDLRVALSGSRMPLCPDAFLVITNVRTRRFALAVDAVVHVREFQPDEEEVATVSHPTPAFVRAFLRDDYRPVVLLEPAGLLEAVEMERLQDLCGAMKSMQRGARHGE